MPKKHAKAPPAVPALKSAKSEEFSADDDELILGYASICAESKLHDMNDVYIWEQAVDNHSFLQDRFTAEEILAHYKDLVEAKKKKNHPETEKAPTPKPATKTAAATAKSPTALSTKSPVSVSTRVAEQEPGEHDDAHEDEDEDLSPGKRKALGADMMKRYTSEESSTYVFL